MGSPALNPSTITRSTRDRRVTRSRSIGSGCPRNSCISAQRWALETSTLGRAGQPMRMGILAGLIDVEAVMRVLDRRDGPPACDQSRRSFASNVVLPLPLHPASPITLTIIPPWPSPLIRLGPSRSLDA